MYFFKWWIRQRDLLDFLGLHCIYQCRAAYKCIPVDELLPNNNDDDFRLILGAFFLYIRGNEAFDKTMHKIISEYIQ